MKGNALDMLAICRKAGRLKLGFDSVEQSLKGDAALVIFTNDISEKTMKRMASITKLHGVNTVLLPWSSNEINIRVGKRVAVMSITDRGLADRVALLLRADNEEENCL